MEDGIKKILAELCAKQDSGDIAQDIIRLFEDIKKFFAAKGEFVDFDNLSPEAKENLCVEIKLLISLLKKMNMAMDKAAVVETISKNLIITLSKHREKYKRQLDHALKEKESQILKQRFADCALLDLYKEYQIISALREGGPAAARFVAAAGGIKKRGVQHVGRGR